MKIKKTIIVFVVLIMCLVLIIIYQFVYGIRYINIVGFSINLETTVHDDLCKQVNSLDKAEGIYFQFKYQDSYLLPLGFLNDFVYRERINKLPIKTINIFLIDKQGHKFDIVPYLQNFIDKSLIHKYVTQELIMPKVTEKMSDDPEGKYTYDRYVEPYSKMIDSSVYIYEIYDKLIEAKLFKAASKLSKIKGCRILNNYLINSFNNNNGVYCPANLPKNNFSEESYIGNIDFFIELYNKDYIQYNVDNLYPGFLMKMNLPNKLKEKKIKAIELSIQFEGKRDKISSTLDLQ